MCLNWFFNVFFAIKSIFFFEILHKLNFYVLLLISFFPLQNGRENQFSKRVTNQNFRDPQFKDPRFGIFFLILKILKTTRNFLRSNKNYHLLLTALVWTVGEFLYYKNLQNDNYCPNLKVHSMGTIPQKLCSKSTVKTTSHTKK